MPQRLKVTLTPETRMLQPNQDFTIRENVRFLYGAPAASSAAKASARISKARNPYPAMRGVSSSAATTRRSATVVVTPTVPETDEQGVALVTGNTGELPDASMPLQATISASVFEPGGRTTDNTLTLPVKTRDAWLGLRPQFEGGLGGRRHPRRFRGDRHRCHRTAHREGRAAP